MDLTNEIFDIMSNNKNKPSNDSTKIVVKPSQAVDTTKVIVKAPIMIRENKDSASKASTSNGRERKKD